MADILKLIGEDDDNLYDDDDSMHEAKKSDPPAKIRIRLNGKTFDRPTNDSDRLPSPPTSPTPPPSPVTSSRDWHRSGHSRHRRDSPDRRRRSRPRRPRRPRRRRFQKFWPPHEYFELARHQLRQISSNPMAFSALCAEWDELHGCGQPTFTSMQGFIDTFGPDLARRLFIFSIATNGTLRGIFENHRQSGNFSRGNNNHNLFR